MQILARLLDYFDYVTRALKAFISHQELMWLTTLRVSYPADINEGQHHEYRYGLMETSFCAISLHGIHLGCCTYNEEVRVIHC